MSAERRRFGIPELAENELETFSQKYAEQFRVPMKRLYAYLQEKRDEGNMPGSVYCMDTMGRVLAYAVRPMLDKLSTQESKDRPDIKFLAPKRSVDLGDQFKEHIDPADIELLKEITGFREDDILRSVANPSNILFSLSQMITRADVARGDMGINEFASNILTSENIAAVQQTRREATINKQDPELMRMLEVVERVEKRLYGVALPHLDTMLSYMAETVRAQTDQKSILCVDDYVHRGQTALKMAALATYLPDRKVDFFGAIVSPTFMEMVQDNQIGYPDNFQFVTGASTVEMGAVPEDVLEMWLFPKRKASFIGVEKNGTGPQAKRSPHADPLKMRLLRTELTRIGESVISDR